MGIQSHHEDIIADKDDECQQSFILLLKELVKYENKAKDNLFRAIIKYDNSFSIHSLIKNNRNHLTRGLY
jgi:predicted acetyltransferase